MPGIGGAGPPRKECRESVFVGRTFLRGNLPSRHSVNARCSTRFREQSYRADCRSGRHGTLDRLAVATEILGTAESAAGAGAFAFDVDTPFGEIDHLGAEVLSFENRPSKEELRLRKPAVPGIDAGFPLPAAR